MKLSAQKNNFQTLESIKKYATAKLQHIKGGDDNVSSSNAGPFDMDWGPTVPTLKGEISNATPFDTDWGPIFPIQP